MVLISIDTLRADRLPAYGYKPGRTPAIDALAADGIRVERAYTAYPMTLPSHVTIFSGQLPPDHGVRDNIGFTFSAASHPCFPKELAAHGYSTGAFVSAWMLRGATGLGSCFQVYDDDLGSGGAQGEQRRGADTLQRAETWLRTVDDKPFFLFLHLFEPHAPYDPPQPFASDLPDPYDGEVATADAVVGSLVAELKRLGRYDDAIIMLVSDHGEGLGDHGELRHGVLLYEETVRVPWIVKLPGEARRGKVLAGPVSLVDLAPTLLGLVGEKPDPAMDGRSIFGRDRDPDCSPIYIETWYPRLRLGWSQLSALVDRRYATIAGPRPELYDLERDPHEHQDLASQRRSFVARRVGELAKLDRPPESSAAADSEAIAKLAALGYLGANAHATSGPLPNPRDRVGALGRFEDAIQADAQGDSRRALVELQQLLTDNPGMVEALPFIARAELHLGHLDDAIATLRRAVAGDPHPSILLELAQMLVQKGELDEAEKLATSVRRDDPRRAYQALVEIAQRRGDKAAVQRWTQAAIDEGAAGLSILRERARRLAASGHPNQAVALLEPHATDADPATLALLGLALADTGRASDGFALLQRARQAAPSAPDVLENFGVVALRLDHVDQGLDALEAAARAAPDRASAWSSLGVARYRSGSPAGAVEAWKRAARLDPENADALYNLGFVAARLGDRALARQALQRYLALSSGVQDADRARARGLLAQLGERGGR